jgi:hypothetical protein
MDRTLKCRWLLNSKAADYRDRLIVLGQSRVCLMGRIENGRSVQGRRLRKEKAKCYS